MSDHNSYDDWDAAYVLGMLSADDRRAFEKHLKTCERCSDAVAELAGLPGLLSALSPEEASALLSAAPLAAAEHVPSLTASLAQRVRRSRVRRRLLTGAVAFVVAGLLTTTGLVIGTSAPQTTVIAASTHAPLVPMTVVGTPVMTAQLGVTKKGWGTRLDWTCQYDSQSRYSASYDLVVTTTSGETETVASWTTTGGPGAKDLSASTGLQTSEIARIDIRFTGSDTPLVVSEL